MEQTIMCRYIGIVTYATTSYDINILQFKFCRIPEISPMVKAVLVCQGSIISLEHI